MIKHRILDLIYPRKCPFCKSILDRNEDGVCKKCREKIPYIMEPHCMKCGKPIKKEETEYCFDCSKKKHHFEAGRSLWVHKPPVSEAVYAFKYQSLRYYGDVFAREIVRGLNLYLKQIDPQVLIPIPLHKRKLCDRGYNQAYILAKGIEKYTGISVADILIRKKCTNPQKLLNDVERRANIEGAFAVKEDISYETVVLIDDIYTTGSTLDEAAKVLKHAGVRKVYFLTISIGQGF